MRFSGSQHRWWTGRATAHDYSLEGRWLPMLGLGGLLTAMILPAWHLGPAAKDVSLPAAAVNATGPADFHQLPTIQIRLRADTAGRLASIAFNGRPVKDIADLRSQIVSFLGPTAADATIEAKLDCDGQLRYEHTQQIISAISSHSSPDGRMMLPLIDRITLAPRKK